MSIANQIIRPADLLLRVKGKPRKRRFTGHVHQRKVALAAMRPVPIPGGVEITVPIRIFNETNAAGRMGGYMGKSRRNGKIKEAVNYALCLCRGLLPPFPCRVELVRHGPGEMDYDGNVIAFKAVRDEIAKFAHLDDAERVGWQWIYQPQVKGEYAVTLRITDGK